MSTTLTYGKCVTHHLACHCREERIQELARLAVEYAPDTIPDDVDAEVIGNRVRTLADELGYVTNTTREDER